jgi:hypothetical protein
VTTSLPNTLDAIISKVRKVTGRPSQAQISDVEIIQYVNTFYVYDMPEHLKMESLRYNYQFTTTANIPVYDLPTDTYLTGMPPVFIAGYQSYMTQSRENFFRVNPELNLLQQAVYTGDGSSVSFSGQFLSSTPIIPGFKPNPPGAFAIWSSTNEVLPSALNWNVVVSALGTADPTSGIAPSYTLLDDGQGHLFAPTDTTTNPSSSRGSINYITGAINITNFVDATGTPVTIPAGNAINVQYIPYVASRPQSVVFFQDQFILYPVPDQAYTVSFESYKYPIQFTINADGTYNGNLSPQLKEWWQLLAYGASDKIFADNADFENLQKFRPLLEEQMNLVLRRTIVQQTSERSATIYTEQCQPSQYPFGNLFSGM